MYLLAQDYAKKNIKKFPFVVIFFDYSFIMF
jgi:hypothetical protein